MTYNPSGSIILLKNVPFDNTYGHTLDFSSEEEQHNYFINQKFHSRYDNYSYLRRERSIKIGTHLDGIRGCNYLMYQNADGKWIYCFITRKVYINDNNTELILETDVIQTFWFDVTWNHTFIEREHCDRWNVDKSPIYSTTEEGLTLGNEYVIKGVETIHEVKPQYVVAITQTVDMYGNEQNFPSTLNGVPSTVCYGFSHGNTFGYDSATLGKSPSVISIAKLPLDVTNTSVDTKYIKTVKYPKEDEWDESMNRQPLPEVGVYPVDILTSYTAERTLATLNKFSHYPLPSLGLGKTFNPSCESKLLCYPYSYGLLTDCQSTPLKVKHEQVEGSSFTVSGVCGVSHSPKAKYYISSGYRGGNKGKLDCLINEKDQQLPLTSDAYKNYILNNSAQIKTSQGVNAVSTVTKTIGGVVTGALAGAKLGGGWGALAGGVVGGFTPLFNGYATQKQELAKQYDLQEIPDSVRSMGNNVTFDIVDGNNKVLYYYMSVDKRTRKILAHFWHMYGYAVNEIKIPNLRSRYYYNFIKTVGCNITGNIDYEDLTRMKEIFDNGITIWHNREGVQPLNYQFDNVEVSLL